jgi:cobyrinic acid a,c-diamide synthase
VVAENRQAAQKENACLLGKVRLSMSIPRLIVAGVEPGRAFAVGAGALLAGLGAPRPVRPILLGLDLPLWRLVYDLSARAPRVLDPMLLSRDAAMELYDRWAEEMDLVVFVAARPLIESWEGVPGSRPCDLAAAFDAPVILALDARDRGASAAAVLHGSRAMAGRIEVGGVVAVGGDESPASIELTEALRREVDLPLLGRVPPQLTEQFMRQHVSPGGRVKTVGPGPARGGTAHLCREAAGYVALREVQALARRSGFLPAAPHRLLTLRPNPGQVSVAAAWGPPLQPVALENVDVLQAMGVRLVPLNLAKDREVPPDADGLLLLGQLDEQQIQRFAANRALLAELRAAVDAGLPAVAMGGGALLLLQRLADSRGRAFDLVGALPAEAELIESYDRPVYVTATATRQNPFDEGTHELYELFDLEFSLLEQGSFAYQIRTPGGAEQAEGFVIKRCLATTLYTSFVACPQLATRFVSVMQFLQGH